MLQVAVEGIGEPGLRIGIVFTAAHHCKLISGQPGTAFIAGKGVGQGVGKDNDGIVPLQMPIGIVDLPQIIYVGDHDQQGQFLIPCPVILLLQRLAESLLVINSGEGIPDGG